MILICERREIGGDLVETVWGISRNLIEWTQDAKLLMICPKRNLTSFPVKMKSMCNVKLEGDIWCAYSKTCCKASKCGQIRRKASTSENSGFIANGRLISQQQDYFNTLHHWRSWHFYPRLRHSLIHNLLSGFRKQSGSDFLTGVLHLPALSPICSKAIHLPFLGAVLCNYPNTLSYTYSTAGSPRSVGKCTKWDYSP